MNTECANNLASRLFSFNNRLGSNFFTNNPGGLLNVFNYEIADPANFVGSDNLNWGSKYDRTNCQGAILSALNEGDTITNRNNFSNLTRCPLYTRSNGEVYSGCGFDSVTRVGRLAAQIGDPTTADCDGGDLVGNKWGCLATWSCPVITPDINYYSLCCNAPNSYLIQGTDPYTGQAFDTRACGRDWCMADPFGECAPIFDSCDAVAPCNRHWLLNFAAQATNDPAMNSLTITPTISGGTGKGVRCNSMYQSVLVQAAEINQLQTVSTDSRNYYFKTRIAKMMETITGFCSDPRYRGQGECACHNGYLSYNNDWSTSIPSGLYSENSGNLPLIVEQQSSGAYRRMDAFCNEANPPLRFTEALSFTLNGVWNTYSNVCSTTTPWSPLERNRPSVNPSRSIVSLTNFGDIAASEGEIGASIALPMPFHCWLPACVAGNGDSSVFRNLWSLGNGQCPSVCYLYSSGDSVNINDIDASVVHIHETYQKCDIGNYKSSAAPFALKSRCTFLDLSVPSNFSNTIHIPLTNLTLDTSSYYSYSTLTAYTDFFPIISLEENNTQTSLIEGVRLSKYSLSTNSLYTLSVTVNTYNTAPYNVLYPTIYLQNEQAESMQIQIRLQILGDTTTGNFNSASCIPCDADFGQDCPVFLESGGQKLYSFPDGDGIYAPREQGNFGGVETGVTRITQEILQASGASQLLLAAHTQLYGQIV